jgi:dienelactone hydrolase
MVRSRWFFASLAALGCATPQVHPDAPPAVPSVSAPPEGAVEAQLRSMPPAPLGVRVTDGADQDGVRVDQLTFRGPGGQGLVHATRVRPPGQGPFAAVLWVHWLGDPETTNRTEFLAEATALARRGLVSLLVDALWSAPQWYATRVPEQDYDAFVRQAQELIRALDLLVAEPGVDPRRIGFVGHDYGAMHGILAGAVDRRPRAWVLVAATPRFANWAFFGPKPKDQEAYLARLALLDPVEFIGRLDGAMLLQFASRDEYIPETTAQSLAAAAPHTTSVQTYDADHAVNVAAARMERDAFLAAVLGLR